MAGKDPPTGQPLAPSESNLVELGGGNLTVKAGKDIDGGIYYVERGNGALNAGNSIHTNSTRAPSAAVATGAKVTAPETTWLPTTLFLRREISSWPLTETLPLASWSMLSDATGGFQ